MVIDLIRLIGSKFKATRVSYFAVALILGLQMCHIVCACLSTLFCLHLCLVIYGPTKDGLIKTETDTKLQMQL
jgi:hypothetical protein